MKKELTKNDLKRIINYIRLEARLSYSLKRMLWLIEETIKIKKETISLAEKFKGEKQLLRNIDKNIFNIISKGDEIVGQWHGVKLK